MQTLFDPPTTPVDNDRQYDAWDQPEPVGVVRWLGTCYSCKAKYQTYTGGEYPTLNENNWCTCERRGHITWWKVSATYSEKARCNASCWNSAKRFCRCSCGGSQHGKGLVRL